MFPPAGNSSPICVVSGARFLAKAGWVDMRNHSDTEPPLRLLRDNGRNYLQVRATARVCYSLCTVLLSCRGASHRCISSELSNNITLNRKFHSVNSMYSEDVEDRIFLSLLQH